jgi:hypothetical protein
VQQYFRCYLVSISRRILMCKDNKLYQGPSSSPFQRIVYMNELNSDFLVREPHSHSQEEGWGSKFVIGSDALTPSGSSTCEMSLLIGSISCARDKLNNSNCGTKATMQLTCEMQRCDTPSGSGPVPPLGAEAIRR